MNPLKSVDDLRRLHKELASRPRGETAIGVCPRGCRALGRAACTSACPAHVNVPEYVGLIAEVRLAAALDMIRRRSPSPSVSGRACHHPCELFCRRGGLDAPVAIRHLKRFVADRRRAGDAPRVWHGLRRWRVAIVGSGPAGLTAGYFLALMGRGVTVLEALDAVGGMLAAGIAPYRLPPEALQHDLDCIRLAAPAHPLDPAGSEERQFRRSVQGLFPPGRPRRGPALPSLRSGVTHCGKDPPPCRDRLR